MSYDVVLISLLAIVVIGAAVLWRDRRVRITEDTRREPVVSAVESRTVVSPPQDSPCGSDFREARPPHFEQSDHAETPSPYRARHAAFDSQKHWDPYTKSESRSERIRSVRNHVPPRTQSNYYALLDLEPGASDLQIERAYKKQVALNHPDRFFDDPESKRQAESRMRELNAVMIVLRDPLKRAQYDANLRL